jgi:DNA transposition AAA+ family ATPase
MSSTRHAAEDEPLSQERYLSSPAFAELYGLNGAAVATRAAIEADPLKRELIWFLQAASRQPGLKAVAKNLATRFPDRMRSAHRVQRIVDRDPVTNEIRTREVKLPVWEKPLEHFLADFCINPNFEVPHTFSDFLGALFEYKRSFEAEARQRFIFTANARLIWESLAHTIKTRKMVLLEGLEGRGKTEAAKAFCLAHQGQARFISLKGITTKTTAFREIAKAIGVASGPTRKAVEMQGRIEEVLQRSQLMLVIDEAHWLFDQNKRITCSPELVDWVTTLSNHGIAISLVATPQFLACMERTAIQVGWNWRQFRRRARFERLEAETSAADLKTVAETLLPGVKHAGIELALGYVKLSGKDLSALGDLVREAGLIAGGKQIRYADLEAAMSDLIASDIGFKEAEKRIAAVLGRKARPRQAAPATLEETPESKSQLATAATSSPRRSCAVTPPKANVLATPLTNSSRLGTLTSSPGDS